MTATRGYLRALILTLPFVAATPLVGQSPWARATLPTACYGDQDEYAKAQETALSELEAEKSRRDSVNKALRDQIFALDPAALQQRLMAAVQKNPAQAQEIMAAIQQQGTQENLDENMAASKEEMAFTEKKDALHTAYKAERDAILGPILARIRSRNAEKGATAEDIRIIREGWVEYNTKYESVICPKWWKDKAPALMTEYRQYQEGQAPARATAEASGKRLLDLFGFSSREYQPTSEILGVVYYLRFAISLYRERQAKPGAPN